MHAFNGTTEETVGRFRVACKTDAREGRFAANAVTYPTRADALRAGNDLFSRWTALRQWRVERLDAARIESDDSVIQTWVTVSPVYEGYAEIPA